MEEKIKKILTKNKVESPFPEGAHLIPDLLALIEEERSMYLQREEDIQTWLVEQISPVLNQAKARIEDINEEMSYLEKKSEVH